MSVSPTTPFPPQSPRPASVDLLSMDDPSPVKAGQGSAPTRSGSVTAAGSGLSFVEELLSDGTSEDRSSSSLFSAAAVLGKQGRAKGAVLVDHPLLRLTVAAYDVRAHRARIMLSVLAKGPGDLFDLRAECVSPVPESLNVKVRVTVVLLESR